LDRRKKAPEKNKQLLSQTILSHTSKIVCPKIGGVIVESTSYSSNDLQYIEDSWGVKSINAIAKNLNRSVGAILNKKGRLGLGPFLDCGEYITVHQFFLAIGRTGGDEYTLGTWLKKDFPIKRRRVHHCSFNIIYLNDFWKWAEEYRTRIDFDKFKENAVGAEPEWVKEQRTADVEFAKYKGVPWTTKEDNQLKSLLKLYKYTYKALSMSLYRTEGALKRRMVDLNIKERPLRESSGSTWTTDQIRIVTEMYYKGYKNDVIKGYVDKSGQAIRGKIERLIKDGLITKWK